MYTRIDGLVFNCDMVNSLQNKWCPFERHFSKHRLFTQPKFPELEHPCFNVTRVQTHEATTNWTCFCYCFCLFNPPFPLQSRIFCWAELIWRMIPDPLRGSSSYPQHFFIVFVSFLMNSTASKLFVLWKAGICSNLLKHVSHSPGGGGGGEKTGHCNTNCKWFSCNLRTVSVTACCNVMFGKKRVVKNPSSDEAVEQQTFLLCSYLLTCQPSLSRQSQM